MSKRINRAVMAFKRSEDCRWYTCLAASRMERPGHIELAQKLNFNDDRHVRNYAVAGLAYRHLRSHDPEVKMLRKGLTIGHFYAIGYAMNRFEFGPREAIEQLRTAMDERVSKEKMAAFIAMEHGSDPKSFLGELEKAIKSVGLLVSYAETEEHMDGIKLAKGVLEDML